MTRTLPLFAGLGLLATACSDYKLQGKGDTLGQLGTSDAPVIQVDPMVVTFPDVDLTTGKVETVSQEITVTNVGQVDLQIDNLVLDDPGGPFDLGQIGSTLLAPMNSTTFLVNFTPTAAATVEGTVYIDSNDPENPQVAVELTGTGVAPMIDVSPADFDFGELLIGCTGTQPITITNVGNADLLVEGLEFTTASIDDFTFDSAEDPKANGPLPWTIAPGDGVNVWVDYTPLDDNHDEAFLLVDSNDPFTPQVVASQQGSGSYYDDNLDVFQQPLSNTTDILFVIDNSCSMSEEQSSLATNFDAFLDELVASDADYQIATITTDNPSFRGSIITPDTPNPWSEFENQVVAGTGGSATERGLEMAYDATQPGQDAGPGSVFLRDGMLAIVFVSDEPDQSMGSWVDYVNYFYTLKETPEDLVLHAVAGDYPSGCHGSGGSASAGTGYYEAVAATGGLFLSICASDWGESLKILADESSQDLAEFPLSEVPVPDTIVVTVDGVTVDDGWSYDNVENAVRFEPDEVPEGGSTIEIEYMIMPECEG